LPISLALYVLQLEDKRQQKLKQVKNKSEEQRKTGYLFMSGCMYIFFLKSVLNESEQLKQKAWKNL
jgi:hypothetical protein